MELLKNFSFDGAQVRVVEREGQPWFVAVDVCRVLELTNPSVVLEGLEMDERAKYSLGRQGDGNVVSESGLYALIFKSRKAKAREFRKWVTSEVLPSIRQQGYYQARQEVLAEVNLSPLATLRKLLLETAQGVVGGAVSVGKAQAVALLGARYLESIKIEGEGRGYENVFGLPSSKTGGGLLQGQNERSGAELLQEVSQPEMRGAGEGKPATESAAASGEAPVDAAASGSEAASRGPGDFSEGGARGGSGG